MNSSYGKLIFFRVATSAVILFLLGQWSIPLDLIAMIIGIWVPAPVVRGIIFALEVLSLMLAMLGLFFGNILGGLFSIAVYGISLYAMCRPDIKERFA